MKIGEKIKVLRTGRRMSQKHLSELIGISQSSIQAYEVGRTEPKDYIVTAIAKELGLAPDALKTENPEENKLIESTFRDLKFNEACLKINEYYNYTPENNKSESTPEDSRPEADQRSILDEIIYPTEPNVRDSGRQEYISVLTGFMNNLNISGLLKVDYFIAELLKDDRYITTDFYLLKQRLGENHPNDAGPENELPQVDSEPK